MTNYTETILARQFSTAPIPRRSPGHIPGSGDIGAGRFCKIIGKECDQLNKLQCDDPEGKALPMFAIPSEPCEHATDHLKEHAVSHHINDEEYIISGHADTVSMIDIHTAKVIAEVVRGEPIYYSSYQA